MTVTSHRFTVRRQDGIGPYPDNLPCASPNCGLPKAAHQAAPRPTPTLGEIAEMLNGLKARGVTLESLRYVAEEKVWWDAPP